MSKVTELVEVEPGQIRNCKHPCPEPISRASGESLVFQQRSIGPNRPEIRVNLTTLERLLSDMIPVTYLRLTVSLTVKQ